MYACMHASMYSKTNIIHESTESEYSKGDNDNDKSMLTVEKKN